MDQFYNRMEAQRDTLRIVNKSKIWKEELCGLSSQAIERWASTNHQLINQSMKSSLIRLSQDLFFLACKSQEQISDEYKQLTAEVKKQIENLKTIFG